MKIIEFVAENFKKIRVVEIRPDGNLVKITGKNGQGKTSALDALWFLLKGKSALPTKALRNGAERLLVKGLFADDKGLAFTVTRTLGEDSPLPTLTIEMAKGRTRDTTPQDFLDRIVSALAFDPLEFVGMEPEEQLEMLRRVAGIDQAEIEKLDEDNQKDYDARTEVNRQIRELDAQIKGMTTLEGLPAEKIDEAAILEKLNSAGELNRRAQEIFKARQELGGEVGRARFAFEENERTVETHVHLIGELEHKLAQARLVLVAAESAGLILARNLKEAEAVYEAAPAGEPIDVTALTMELQAAQRTNRAIEQRAQQDALKKQAEARQEEARKLTRAMEAREETKRTLLGGAKIPVDGLELNGRKVLYKGLPLANLGEGEQLRISAEIGIAANPELRVMSIRHGEALDEDGLAALAALAKKHDFQIWMAKVDSSGKVGIVLEDGMVVARNREE